MNGQKNGARFEIKFLIPPEKSVALQRDIRALTEYDPHTTSSTDGYWISSLYYESPSRHCYGEKVDGVARRLKFRIRTYPSVPDVRFFEIKERCNNRIRKRKTPLTGGEYAALMAHRLPPALRGNGVMREFWMHRNIQGLAPMLLITYSRRAFIGRGNQRLRITFDENIKAQRARTFEQPLASARPVFSRGHAVLEIKFDNLLPRWVHDLIHKYSLLDIAVSKFCLGMDVLMSHGVIQHG